MGAGKTQAGRVLARLLGLPFIDADREIEERLALAKETLESLSAGQQEQLHPEAVLAQLPATPPQQALALF